MSKSVNRENAAAGLAGEDRAVLAGSAAVPEAVQRPLRELMDDRLLDALLERSRDQAGGLRLTGVYAPTAALTPSSASGR